MEIPTSFSPEFLEAQIQELLKNNSLDNAAARVRFTTYRREGGYYAPATREIDYLIEAVKLDSPFYLLNTDPYEIELFKDHYVNSGLLSTIKTNNRAINVLGSIFAQENQYSNCLLLNENKMVVEALNGNVFLVKDKIIKTPPLIDGALNGIVRKQLIAMIKLIDGLQIEESSILPFDLQKADELFITNVIAGIQPVTKYRKKDFNSEIAGGLLTKLNVKARLG